MNLSPEKHTLELPFEIAQPKRWWTKELGEQHRYALQVKLVQSGTTLDQIGHKVGLRTVRVVQTPDEKAVRSMSNSTAMPCSAKAPITFPTMSFCPESPANNTSASSNQPPTPT